MAVEVAAEEVAKRLGYKDWLRNLQRQVAVELVGCRDVFWGSCLLAMEVSFWSLLYRTNLSHSQRT